MNEELECLRGKWIESKVMPFGTYQGMWIRVHPGRAGEPLLEDTGATFSCPDGYRVVLQNAAWST